jgi:hypothetical protein
LGDFRDRPVVPGPQVLDYWMFFYGSIRHFWRSRCVGEGFQSSAPFFHR